MARERRGNYAMLTLVATVAMLSFGALAVDSGYMILADAQSQDIADAASQAALIAYRQTGDIATARTAAQLVVEQNEVVGESPSLDALTFGSWDDTEEDPEFLPSMANINAVRATVSRSGDDAVDLLMSRIWGYESFRPAGQAVSASRSAEIIVVLDITASWGEVDFAGAREAVVNAVDTLTATAGPQDRLGMAIFNGPFAWEFTPLQLIADSDTAEDIRDDWDDLITASLAGRDSDPVDGRYCSYYTGRSQDNFASPAGGCYPWMPRLYIDEATTDHTQGLRMAQTMFEESDAPSTYRAVIIITDGRPNSVLATAGDARDRQGHVETRWRELRHRGARNISQIRAAATAASQEMWNELGVHSWVISFVADDPLMTAMVQGDGYYVRTSDATRINGIMQQILRELPLAIVE